MAKKRPQPQAHTHTHTYTLARSNSPKSTCVHCMQKTRLKFTNDMDCSAVKRIVNISVQCRLDVYVWHIHHITYDMENAQICMNLMISHSFLSLSLSQSFTMNCISCVRNKPSRIRVRTSIFMRFSLICDDVITGEQHNAPNEQTQPIRLCSFHLMLFIYAELIIVLLFDF